MGNQNSAALHNPSYIQLRIQQNQLLSRLVVAQKIGTKELQMIKLINIANQIEFERIVKQLKQRKYLSEKKAGKFIIQLKHFEMKQYNQICGKTFKIWMYLEYLQATLKQVYQDKQKNRISFSQEEIIQILKAIVSNLIILHDNNLKNLHIYKESIFLTEHGQYKLVDTQLSNRIHPYFQILNTVPVKTGTYLAPELIEDLKRQSADFYHSPKADIFTLAIVVLQLCTFINYDQYFNYQAKSINLSGLRQIIQQINFSSNLKNILLTMVVEDQQQRVGLISLKQMIAGGEVYEETYTIKTNSQQYPVKNTARTFISRSKPDSKVSKNSSLQKHKTEISKVKMGNQQDHIKFNKPFSQFSSQIQPTHTYQYEKTKPIKIDNYAKMDYAQPIYTPIQTTIACENHKTCPNYEIKQTPRASMGIQNQLGNKIILKQFDTPVNLLINYQPDTTPIQQMDAFMHIKPSEQQHKYNQFSTQIFNNKTYGRHIFSNGAKYEGQFNSSNEFDGNGMLYYPNGKLCYTGSWKSNSFCGFGVLHNEDPIISNENELTNYMNFNYSDKNNWNYYEGEFDDDKKEGFGTLYMMNGDKFSGCFKNDTIEGFGTFFLAKQGRNINGIWQNNILKK